MHIHTWKARSWLEQEMGFTEVILGPKIGGEIFLCLQFSDREVTVGTCSAQEFMVIC